MEPLRRKGYEFVLPSVPQKTTTIFQLYHTKHPLGEQELINLNGYKQTLQFHNFLQNFSVTHLLSVAYFLGRGGRGVPL